MEKQIAVRAIPLFNRVRDSHPNVHHFAYYLEYLTFHMPERLLIPSLEWLIRNSLTSERFLNFIMEECKMSGLELVRVLTMRLEKEKKPRRLHAKDLRG